MTAQPEIEQTPSPNHDARDAAKPVDILLLHYTGMLSGEGALRWLCNPEAKVSSHYLVFEDGRTVQLVDETRRAWHAGRSHWAGETDINTRSVGIEIVNAGHQFGGPPFPAVQIAAVIALCSGIVGRHPIPPERVLAHSDVGSMDKAGNRAMIDLVSSLLPPALAPGALVMADLPLEIEGAERLPLPPGAREDRYYVFRWRPR